jgi:3-oxoadipate enol-lactonase
MPTTRNDDVELHWETTGSGPPALLIMGLGMTSLGWWRTVPVLAEGLQVITFDNRGVGGSDRPEGPYSLADMTADCVAVLDAAEADCAHVYGISLGGMIAQQLALAHPERVARLVLGATTPGGDRAVPIDDGALAFFHRRGEMSAEEAVWASVPYNYSARTRREGGDRIAEDVERRLRIPIEQAPYRAQLAASLSHDTGERLGHIAAPTLVVHGEEDRMVPPGNGAVLAEGIPSARLETWADAGHLYPTDEPGADLSVREFLIA